MTIEEALAFVDDKRLDGGPATENVLSVLAAEVRRLRDEVNRMSCGHNSKSCVQSDIERQMQNQKPGPVKTEPMVDYRPWWRR